VTRGASGALSVQDGPDVFALKAHASETIAAKNLTSETFELSSGFGHTSISGFTAAGSNSDVLGLQLSMFNSSWFTQGMTPDEEALALLSHATGSSNTTIVDSVGDVLTLIGTSRSTLSNNPDAIRLS
jgi:hypothetical protein